MRILVTFFVLSTIVSSARASSDGFYSSVNELNLILADAENLKAKLGTAYRIESIVTRPGDEGYLISAKTNQGKTCTADVKVTYTFNPNNYMAAPTLGLRYESVSCN